MSDDPTALEPTRAGPANAATEGPAPEVSPRHDGRATRLGRAARRLGERTRSAGGGVVSGLGPLAQTVRQDLRGAFGHLRRQRHLGLIAASLALVLYLLSGTYLVSPGEMAVVTRFGKVVQPRVTPGLRWRLPWPIERVRTTNVSQVRREGIGISMPGHTAEFHPSEDIQLLTGDENLLTAKAVVQYRIKEPADYLFRVDYNEDPLLRAAVKSAMVELAGATQVDVLLTSGRTAFQQQAREQVQQTLDAYRSGIEVVSIDLQEIAPPGDVAQSFRDVASAAEEKNRLMNEAQGYANSIVPQARGEAERRIREGEGYRTDVVNRATGEAQRFADVLTQYQRDAQIFGPEVTRFRLYVETMEKILPKAKKFIVEPNPNGDQVNVRIVDQLPGTPPSQGARP
jgi:membrane protease subunit HflK